MSADDNNKIHLPTKLFNCQEVKKRMHEILHDHLHSEQYDSSRCNFLAKNLSNIIKDSLKMLDYERYKFIVQIVIVQQNDESFKMISRSYWDSETDKFAQSIYINQFLICVATTFAIFYY